MAKIMLVEDDNNLREIYEARLMAEGYEIVTARDGEEALAIAVKERPDLIISDVMMPKISGFDMLDILRSTPETKNTKVIMMTALSQAEDKARADKLGADRYLVKSQVTLEDVAKVAREVLEGDDAAADTNTGQTDTPSPENTNSTPPVVATPTEPPMAVAAAPASDPAVMTATPLPAIPAAPVAPIPVPITDSTQPAPIAQLPPMPVAAPAPPQVQVASPVIEPVQPPPIAQPPSPTVPPAAMSAMAAAPAVTAPAAAMGITDLSGASIPSPTAPQASPPVASDPLKEIDDSAQRAAALMDSEDVTAHAATAWAIDDSATTDSTSSATATPQQATSDAETKVDAQAPQSLADEEAAIAKQIESYMDHSGDAVTGTTLTEIPGAQTAESLTDQPTLPPQQTTVPEPPTVIAPPAPVEVANPTESTGQKIIQPINDLSKSGAPDLNKLAAAEEALNPTTGNVIAPNDPGAVDPNSLAL